MNILFVSTLQNVDFAQKVPLFNLPIANNTSMLGGGGGDDKCVTLCVKKGYGLLFAFSQQYHTRPQASRKHQAVFPFYKEDN